METLINNYGRLIDKIRKDRNKSRQDLCEDIMSTRNFQRFANGEVQVSHDKILKLIDRLRLDYSTLNQMLKYENSDVNSKLAEAHKHLLNWDNDKVKITLATIDYDALESEYLRFEYNFIKLMLQTENKVVESTHFYNELKSLINYPNILEHKILNTSEINGLILLNSKLVSVGDRTIVDYFVDFIHKSTYLKTVVYDKTFSVIYSAITKGYYSLGEYQKCIDLCEEGIEYCINKNLTTGLVNLFGYKALAEQKLNLDDKALSSALKAYMQLMIEGNEKKTEIITDVLENSLNIKFKDYIMLNKRNA